MTMTWNEKRKMKKDTNNPGTTTQINVLLRYFSEHGPGPLPLDGVGSFF
jgi:hypothetical protein